LNETLNKWNKHVTQIHPSSGGLELKGVHPKHGEFSIFKKENAQGITSESLVTKKNGWLGARHTNSDGDIVGFEKFNLGELD